MSIVVDRDAPVWAHAMATQLNRELTLLRAASALKSINVANLPTRGDVNIAIVPDASGGSTIAHFDTASQVWRKPDGTVVT
jgi:hypothetical protein